ncbi:hypothetical protein NL676_021486 [Syzygium grande]|nr:hypothetical protein NL676_021486 [Syzygium grande]
MGGGDPGAREGFRRKWHGVSGVFPNRKIYAPHPMGTRHVRRKGLGGSREGCGRKRVARRGELRRRVGTASGGDKDTDGPADEQVACRPSRRSNGHDWSLICGRDWPKVGPASSGRVLALGF